MDIVASALGIVGKLVAKPAADSALRRERVIQALKTLHLDPRVPPQDFDSLYACTLVEYCANRPESVLAVFRDKYVLAAFRRSFDTADGWERPRGEVLDAVERNRETGEFGHLDGPEPAGRRTRSCRTQETALPNPARRRPDHPRRPPPALADIGDLALET